MKDEIGKKWNVEFVFIIKQFCKIVQVSFSAKTIKSSGENTSVVAAAALLSVFNSKSIGVCSLYQVFEVQIHHQYRLLHSGFIVNNMCS